MTPSRWGAIHKNDTAEAIAIEPPEGTFVDVSLSRHNGCGVQSSGQMSCWGDNSSGQSYPP